MKSPVSEEVTSLTPDLSWAGIDVAAGYFVEVSKGEETSSYWSGTFSMTNITFPEDPPLEFGNTYFWTVRPLNADGELIGEKSDIAEFSVKEAQLMQVTLSEPMGEISTQSPTFSWQEAKAAVGYVIQVNSNKDFSNSWSTTVGNTTVQYSGSEQLEFSQEYYWRIMPLNQDEEAIGNWSEPGSFNITTANILTDAFQLIKSANIFATGKDTVPAKPAIRVINIIASLALVPLTFVT